MISVSDEFFAEAYHLLEVGVRQLAFSLPVLAPEHDIQPAPSLKGQFGPKGALYSGWESRRHNPAHDWCIIRLGAPSGHIVGFDIDTSHFSGNEATAASVGACFVECGSDPPKWDDDQVLLRLP